MMKYLAFASLVATATATTTTCADYHLDFEGPERGEYVTDYWKDTLGVEIVCHANNAGDDGRCRILDSSNPVGNWSDADVTRVGGSGSSLCAGNTAAGDCGDPDLGSPNNQCPGGGPGVSSQGVGGPDSSYPNCDPQGNILIVDENGPLYAPDDAVGGSMTFTFTTAVDMEEVCYIDLDGAEETYVDLFYEGGGSTTDIPTIIAGDNGYACTDLSAYKNVNLMVFRMSGSGSVSDVKWSTPCPVTTTTSATTTTPASTTTTEATTTTQAATTTTLPTTTTTQKVGGGGGDPHFQRWGHEHDSFHGECDLVMVSSKQFHDGVGFDLHARTTIESYFSYIETASLRIGQDIVQFYNTHLFINGFKLTPSELPFTFGEETKYTIEEDAVPASKNTNFHKYYKVDLSEGSYVMFKFYKQFLTIAISGNEKDFGDSVGLLGEYHTGAMISRDGGIMKDFINYGFEWQVNPEDPILFKDSRSPQLPFEECRLPTAARPARRRLRGDTDLTKQAHIACAHVTGSAFELCVDDVVTTSDVGIASLW